MNDTQKSIIGLYAMLVAGAVLTVTPYSLFPIAGMACVLVVWLSVIFQKFRSGNDEAMTFHLGYINRIILWSFLILLASLFLFGCMVFFNGDISAINRMMQSAEKGIILEAGDIAKMNYEFVMANKELILFSALLCAMPYPLFIIYKSIMGVKILIKKEG